jgi:hypothetical protein
VEEREKSMIDRLDKRLDVKIVQGKGLKINVLLVLELVTSSNKSKILFTSKKVHKIKPYSKFFIKDTAATRLIMEICMSLF